MNKYDFAGWVTKNDLKCADGVTIKQDAFSDCDGKVVPLMWQHTHNSPINILGKVLLKNKKDGVYGYGSFNDSEKAISAKKALLHGDINALSIGANKIKKNKQDVVHGNIYEVSLVLSGANPGARIDEIVAHSGSSDNRIILYTDELLHVSPELKNKGANQMTDEEINAVLASLDEDQAAAVELYLNNQLEGIAHKNEDDDDLLHDDKNGEDDELDKMMKSFTPEQQDFVLELMEQLLGSDSKEGNTTAVAHSDDLDQSKTGGSDDMKKNLFATTEDDIPNTSLKAREVVNEVLKHGFETGQGTFKKALFNDPNNDELMHGITNIEVLFPEAKALTPTPTIYKEGQTNAAMILDRIHKSPFGKVKAWQADINEEDARARGYIKGNEKLEEVFKLLSRSVSPQTVYKKQALDRDDIIDIDFDVVPFINSEMQLMLKEEVVRAVLVGDSRPDTINDGGSMKQNPDKIDPKHIIPIFEDPDALYTITHDVPSLQVMIEDLALQLADYQGTGLPDLYVNPKIATKLRFVKDATGKYLFNDIPSLDQVASKIGVASITPSTFLKEDQYIMTNLSDYTLGAAKGGEISSFDDFDIDFNKYKYLIETRLSGMLTMPKAAIKGHILNTAYTTPVINTHQVGGGVGGLNDDQGFKQEKPNNQNNNQKG